MFKKPDRDRIRVWLLVGTVGLARFCRRISDSEAGLKVEKSRMCGRRRYWVWACCGRIIRQRKA